VAGFVDEAAAASVGYVIGLFTGVAAMALARMAE
jgi:hypothetical protein